VKVLYDKIVECAKAAAQASQTRLAHKFHSATWNSLGNKAGAELINDNMRELGPPVFTEADQALAKTVQRSLGKPEAGLSTTLVPLTPPLAFGGGISTDTADVSWHVPTVTALAATFPVGLPNHNWAVTATAATNIGHQGLLAAARYLASTAVDLITQPEQLAAITDEFRQRTAGVKWESMIPAGTQPPMYDGYVAAAPSSRVEGRVPEQRAYGDVGGPAGLPPYALVIPDEVGLASESR
jgi:aminobenzoyl-glutamate utilization protein B